MNMKKMTAACLSAGCILSAFADFNITLDLSGKPMYNPSRSWNAPWPLEQQYVLDERAGRPAAYIHYTQDPVFSLTLKALVEERNGLAEGISRFKQMTPDEQQAFYDKASDMLFNFRYDVEKAYAAYVDDKLFAE